MNDMDGKLIRTMLRGEDGQVWSIVLKILLAVVVVGAIIIQFGPIIHNYITIHGTADDALDEAVSAYMNSRGNMEYVNQAVKSFLDERNARLVGTINVVKGQGGAPETISITVRKIVNTYLFEKVSYLCQYTEAVAYSERSFP